MTIAFLTHFWLFWIFVFAFGAIFGSFFNCLIYRLPNDISIVRPRSFCPQCGNAIPATDNIPILSYLLLGGRCRICRNKIPTRYLLVELLTAVFSLAIAYWLLSEPRHGWDWVWAAFVAAFLLVLIPISWIDLEHRIIPDAFTLPALGIGFAVSFIPGGITPLDSLIGLLAGGGFLYAVGWIGEKVLKKGEAMGGGDVKLMAAAGSLLGFKSVLLSLVLGSVLGSVVGISILAVKGWKSDHRIAFGPYLAIGVVIALFWSNAILGLYSRLILRMALAIAQ